MINKKIILSQGNSQYIGKLKVDENLIHIESSLCSITRQGEFYFYILQDVRIELQKNNVFILVNGSRKDVFSSGMTLASYKAYIHVMGKPTSLDDLVNIFDDFTDSSMLSTVEEQNTYHDLWVESIRTK